MKKLRIFRALPLLGLVALSACMEGGAEVSRNLTAAAPVSACPGIPYMTPVNNLPVRCGPQTVSPYTYAD